jgi:arylsulfatase A-like enzyme
MADNTIILFTSDQGLAVGGRHGLMGKQHLYEHNKPPLVIAGPGIPKGKSDALVYLFDLFPTICELAGVATPSVAEGKSLLPVVRGEDSKVRDELFCAYRGSQRMIRDDRWKLIEYSVGGARNTQLFDLTMDPQELVNLADQPEFAATQRRLANDLREARKRFGDPADRE